MKMIKLQLGKEERGKQNQGDQDKGIRYVLFFCDQDTIESVITFMIDNCTIKRENVWLNGLSSATR